MSAVSCPQEHFLICLWSIVRTVRTYIQLCVRTSDSVREGIRSWPSVLQRQHCSACSNETFSIAVVFLTETLDTASFSLTTSYWTATYRKVQMLTAVALYTDVTKEFCTFRMSTVSRYADDGNLMTPIGKTLHRFTLNLVTD
jgi:hypothetical protein